MKSYDQVIHRPAPPRQPPRRPHGRSEVRGRVPQQQPRRPRVLAGGPYRPAGLPDPVGVSYAMRNNGIARTGSDLPFLEFAPDVSAHQPAQAVGITNKTLVPNGATNTAGGGRHPM